MKKVILSMLLCMAELFSAKAQIGYQVSLLNTATGEPRANVTVNATVTITNSKGESIYTGTQSATSNDFGVLSLTVGNANTFKDVDFGKLPFFIEVSVDGQMIGKSQILNVPVAEAAKTLASAFSLDELCNKKWEIIANPYNSFNYGFNITFYPDMTCLYESSYEVFYGTSGADEFPISSTLNYKIQGNLIIVYGNLNLTPNRSYLTSLCFYFINHCIYPMPYYIEKPHI